MLALRHHTLPPEKQAVLRKAVIAEWITIAVLLSIIFVMYLTLGSSQAMRTAWIEDLLSLIPPIGFLISIRIAKRPANKRYPYGYHRAVSIAFLCGAVAVLCVGITLLIEGLHALIARDHPTIGAVTLFGETFWLGWLMIAALVYSAVPPVLLGLYKQKLARQVHDKTLFADASMNRADWLTALAAIVGISGVALGWWWADATAASLIALDIARDGFGHVKTSVADLMNRHVMTIDEKAQEKLPGEIVAMLKRLPWVEDAAVRLREEGHIFLGEAFVVPRGEAGLMDNIADAVTRIEDMDWRAHEIVMMPVREIHRPDQGAEE
jgi:cation diffusion facilitator family transporter